jgi:hypothetical protein
MNTSLNFGEAAKASVAKLVAITLSVPSWIFVVSFISYRLWDGCCWPNFAVLVVPCVICAVCSLISMTAFLTPMSDSENVFAHVLWVVWAALPVLLGILYGCLVWYWITIGEEYSGYYWHD